MGCFSCFPKEKRQGVEDATQGKKRSMHFFSCFPGQEGKKRNVNCFSCFSSEESTERKKRNVDCFSCFQTQDMTQEKTRNVSCFSCFGTQKSIQAEKDATRGKTPKMGCFSCFPKKDLVQEKTQNTNRFSCFTARNSTQVKKDGIKRKRNFNCFSCFPTSEKKDPTQGKKRKRSYFSCFPTHVKKDSTEGKRRNLLRFSCFATRWKRRNKRLRRFGKCHCLPFPLKTKNEVLGKFQDQDFISPNKAKKKKVGINGNLSAKNFTFKELAIATKNFKEECLLGEGGFGRVYKGKLEKTGEYVAVKQLNREGKQGNREFLVEIMILNHLCHPHLVNLIGYCAEGEQRLLVYEYMAAGSLENHLLDLPPGKRSLDWLTRIKIALHAAKGLEYLHEMNNPPIIYRDLKSSNILLDKDLNAKLSDFGLAKLGPVGDKTHVSSRVMGTLGYCAPEYQKTGKLTVKSDIYSYGVVLLELITGRRAVDLTRDSEELHLVQWVEPRIKDPRKYPEVVDPLLEGKYPRADLSQVLAVAAMCLGVNASLRPSIRDVVAVLDSLVQDSVPSI